MGRGWGGERREGRQHWWVCEKGSDQLIGKTDHEGEGERMEGSVRQQCVLLDVGVGGMGWEGNRIGLVCGTHGEDNRSGGGRASVTRFCFVARSTGVCHGCRLASPSPAVQLLGKHRQP